MQGRGELERGLALRILEALTGTRLTVLLALDHAGVSGQETSLLERRAHSRIGAQQRPRHTVPDGTGLTRESTAIDVHLDVELALARHDLERLLYDHAQHFAAEETLMRNSDYPDSDAHLELHDEFRTRFSAMKAELSQAGSSVSLIIEMNEFLLRWFILHIKGVDANLGLYLER